jgi:hypothetical protein
MNTLKLTIIVSLIIVIVSRPNKPTVYDLKKLAVSENYPTDIFLDTVSNKRALIIVAHNDDDCAIPIEY